MPNTNDRDILACVEQLLKVEPSEESIERAKQRVRLLLTDENSSRPSSLSRGRRIARSLVSGLVAAAVVASLAWAIVPAPFVVFSELRIQSVTPDLMYRGDSDRLQFETYKTTQMKLIKSPFVLAAALRDPRLTGQARLAMGQDPAEWLGDHLRVTSPATEFVRIELRGEKPDWLAACVDAVTVAYVEEVVHSKRKGLLSQKRHLEAVYRELQERLDPKRNAVGELTSNEKVTSSAKVNSLLKHMVEAEMKKRPEIERPEDAMTHVATVLQKLISRLEVELATPPAISLYCSATGEKPQRDHSRQIVAASLSGLVAFLIVTGWLWRRERTGRQRDR